MHASRRQRAAIWSGVSAIAAVVVLTALFVSVFSQLGPDTLRLMPMPPATLAPIPSPSFGAQGERLKSIVTAQGIDSSFNPIDVSSYFDVNSTVYVVMTFDSVAPEQTATISCEWYLNGVNFGLKTEKELKLQKTANFRAYCALPYNAVGNGMARVYWNRPDNDTSESASDPYLAATINFAVVNPKTPTATGAR
jgi:hypothetical protein